ncbi:MAG TPA: HAMP domain-containing sensor histidine kinase [Acidimicrobiales bacterium]|jgi:two-component system, OmpR family, sensor kinase|nr:HAMP domain-containing sensor histidine kinase [Acidimicrobiales bacterium]
MSLRRRVLAAFLLIALVLVGTNVLLLATFRTFLFDRLDRQLVTTAATLADRPPPRGDRGFAQRCFTNAGDREEVFTEFFIACGSIEAGVLQRVSSPLRDDNPRIERDALIASMRPDGTARPYTTGSESGSVGWRLVAVPTPNGAQVYVVGVTLDQLTDTLRTIRFVQFSGTATVLVALSLLSWWMVRLGVTPIESMARTANEIAAGDLSRRVEHVDERTEVGRLGSAFNTMLERISEAFRAREASEARVRRFAADASHELRTPLTSIRGYAELWRAGGLRDEAELAEAMRRMESEATRMGALVEDLLLLARLDQHRPLERTVVGLDRLAHDAVRDARAVEPTRPIDIDAEPVTVDGDEAQLRQVIGNLLANARTHTPPDAAVHVRVFSTDGAAVVEVADEGPGMAPDVAEKVFERFFRADESRARAAGGTGLGLSIVEAVARAHGGRATVRTAPGEGATFVVELPLTETT